MSKFVIECPSCGKYAEAKTGFFARRKIDCDCGYTIDVRTDRLSTRLCPHCGNLFVYDAADGDKVRCPVCHEKISVIGDKTKLAEFSCGQCGVRLQTTKGATKYVCPVCDFENNIEERLMSEKIQRDGLASIIKYEGDGDTLVWKHPIEDFNFGSQLIVHESQEAIFFRDGQALDLFGAGRYTLETQQLPLLEKLYKLPTDTEGTFHSEVYYINKVTQMAMKWGTSEKIRIIDPLTDAPMSIAARGSLNLRVADSRKLLMRLVGTTSGLKREDILGGGNSWARDYFRSVIQLGVGTHLAEVIKSEKIDVVEIDAQRLLLSTALREKLSPYFEEYGMEIAELLVEGIMLPQPGDLGYDTFQTILKLRQAKLRKSVITTETDIEMFEQEAKKRLDIQRQLNQAEIEIARRGLVSEKGETSVLEAQLEGRRKVAAATADTEAERLKLQLEMERKAQTARIEAEEMRAKGYTQRDVLQAEVQKSYAEGIGNMGPAISAGGGSGTAGILGDMLGLSVGMAAASAVAPQIGDMMGSLKQSVTGSGPANAVGGWDCAECSTKNITTKFCPNCGAKKPEPAVGWDCPDCGTVGIVTNFCPNCGRKKPEAPTGWDCPACGTKNIATAFCPNCGAKKPADTWTCPDCGQTEIKTAFCPNCGKKRDE